MSKPSQRIPGGTFLALLLILGAFWTAAAKLSRPVVRDQGDLHATEMVAAWPDMRVDLNSADVAELALLPSIGPRLAERIVEYRRVNGPFRSVEAVTAVKWIGPSHVERIRPYVIIEPSSVPQ